MLDGAEVKIFVISILDENIRHDNQLIVADGKPCIYSHFISHYKFISMSLGEAVTSSGLTKKKFVVALHTATLTIVALFFFADVIHDLLGLLIVT